MGAKMMRYLQSCPVVRGIAMLECRPADAGRGIITGMAVTAVADSICANGHFLWVGAPGAGLCVGASSSSGLTGSKAW